jgi:hypothetical protein
MTGVVVAGRPSDSLAFSRTSGNTGWEPSPRQQRAPLVPTLVYLT